jgi:hypothetical protein
MNYLTYTEKLNYRLEIIKNESVHYLTRHFYKSELQIIIFTLK